MSEFVIIRAAFCLCSTFQRAEFGLFFCDHRTSKLYTDTTRVFKSYLKRNIEYISSVCLSCIKIKRENNAAGELCAQSSVKQELK